MIIEMNDNNMDEYIVGAKVPVIVEFSAPWCTHCKHMEAIIEEFSEEVADRAIVGSLNTDVSTVMVHRYKIRSLPTFISFKNGEVADKIVGEVDKEELYNMLG